MNDLPIGIKFDPGDVLQRLRAVEDALHKTEDRGDALGRTMSGVAGKFRSLGEAIRQHMSATAHSAGQAMRGLADAVALEARMLEMATGRARDFGFQVAALQRLHDQGRLSAEQYMRALEKIGAMPKPGSVAMGNPIANQRAQTQQAMNTIGLGPAPKSGPTISNSQALMAFGAAGAVAATAAQLAAIDDKYTNLSNSALKFADAGRNVAIVLEDQRRLASELHMGLGDSMGAYDAVRDATDELNLTYAQQIRLTKTLGEAAALGGKSSESAAEAMHALKVAFETGQDPGRALIGIFKQYPDLADQLSTSLGKSRGEIVRLARDGQLSFRDLATGLIKNTDDIDAKFGKRAVTWGHNWEELRDAVEKPFDVMGTINAFMNVDMAINRVVQDTQKLAAQWKQLEDDRNFDKKRAAELMRAATEMAEVQAGGFDAAKAAQDAAVEWARDQEQATARATAKAKELAKEYEKIGRALLGGDSAVDRAIRGGTADRAAQQAEIELVGRLEHEAGFKGAVRFAAEMEQLNRLVDEGRLSLEAYYEARQKAFAASGGTGVASSDFFAPGIDFAGTRSNLSKSSKGVAEMQDTLAEQRREQLKKTKQEAEELIRTVEPLGEAFGRAFRGGDDAAKNLLDTLTAVGFKLLELGAISAFGPAGGIGVGFLRGIMGGKTGFDHVIGGGSGLELPGFARGGDAMIGGYRGTDKTLVAFWGTPGESVHVRTPAQRAEMGGGWMPESLLELARLMRPTLLVPDSRRDLANDLDSWQGEVGLVELERRRGRRSRRT